MPETFIEYEDGKSVRVGPHHSTLVDAVKFGLDLADRAGMFQGDGHGRPTLVKVYCRGYLELSIAIVPGGLLNR